MVILFVLISTAVGMVAALLASGMGLLMSLLIAALVASVATLAVGILLFVRTLVKGRSPADKKRCAKPVTSDPSISQA